MKKLGRGVKMGETKICHRCNVEKNIEEFRLKKVRNKYVRYYICKCCEKAENKAYREKNKERLYKKAKEWRNNNKQHIKDYNKSWESKNREIRLKYFENYRKTHVEERKMIDNICKAKRKKQDKIFKLKCQIRTMIATCFKRKEFSKNKKNEEILGCTYEIFINHLLQTYKNNYKEEWDGKEKVHIDHIKPLKLATTKEEVIKLCHYTNLQLLKSMDNLKKRDKINWNLEGKNE